MNTTAPLSMALPDAMCRKTPVVELHNVNQDHCWAQYLAASGAHAEVALACRVLT